MIGNFRLRSYQNMSFSKMYLSETSFINGGEQIKVTITCEPNKLSTIMEFIMYENQGFVFKTPEKPLLLEKSDPVCPTQHCITCYVNGVKKFASYCFPGDRPTKCSKHRTEEMVPPASRCCQYDGCVKTASFNDPGAKGVRFCVTHKTADMVSKNTKKSGIAPTKLAF
jgi:hypothetical protein